MASIPNQALFNRLLEGELSPFDTDDLIEWLGNEDLDPAAAELIAMHLKQSVAAEQVDSKIIATLEAKLPDILGRQKTTVTGRVRALKTGWLRYAAAAIIVFFSAGAYLWMKPGKKPAVALVNHMPAKKEIVPGKSGAILTLNDNTSVVLDSLGNGVVATQSGSKVVLQNGQLVYVNGSATSGTGISYNTMSTPKGRQFQLVLPDGSKVWLNAASSVRYPTAFTGNERKVEITGEAYFEVAKNPARPFRVKLNDQTEIEVLGTHFNINSYVDEASINTTLLEGSVKVFNGTEKVILKPGQQAQVGSPSVQSGKSSHMKIINDVNVDKVMAWKNGVFNFQDATLHEVMRQLERWYDIEVVYENGVPELEFMGTMDRDLNLADVLKGLKLSGVHFRVEDRKLIVIP